MKRGDKAQTGRSIADNKILKLKSHLKTTGPAEINPSKRVAEQLGKSRTPLNQHQSAVPREMPFQTNKAHARQINQIKWSLKTKSNKENLKNKSQALPPYAAAAPKPKLRRLAVD